MEVEGATKGRHMVVHLQRRVKLHAKVPYSGRRCDDLVVDSKYLQVEEVHED